MFNRAPELESYEDEQSVDEAGKSPGKRAGMRQPAHYAGPFDLVPADYGCVIEYPERPRCSMTDPMQQLAAFHAVEHDVSAVQAVRCDRVDGDSLSRTQQRPHGAAF